MKIAVRLDDITPDMDWERFFKFKALLDRYQVKPLIGIIPDNRDDSIGKRSSLKEHGQKAGKAEIPSDFWEYVKKLEESGWVPAMHGFQHVYTTRKGGLFPLNNFSEFAGVSFAAQKEMLQKGKDLLKEKGVETDIFMAPAHSYDRNTLKALKEVGFKALTDGFGDKPYIMEGLKFYPVSFNLSRTFQKEEGYSTMVVHTGTVSEKDLERYEGYFRRQDVQWISYGEYLQQEAVKRGRFARWKEFCMAKGKYWVVKWRNRK